MVVIHFIENKNVVLTQFRETVPLVDEDIRIKGKKGKITSCKEIEENVFQINIIFEQIVKKQVVALDNKKRRR